MTTAELRKALYRAFKDYDGDNLPAFFVTVETLRNRANENVDMAREILDDIMPPVAEKYVDWVRDG